MKPSMWVGALCVVWLAGCKNDDPAPPPPPPPPPPPATFTVGGSVSGLTGSVVLQNNAGANLSLSANGAFTFATPVTSGAAYAVTVLTQPAGQTCTVTNGSGTAAANITNVAVACTTNAPPTFTIGGTVSGLTGTVVLQNNAGSDLSVSANGSFTFATPVASGGAYAVTVLTQPVGQACTVANGSGVAAADVTNVAVSCVAAPSGPTLSLELRPGSIFRFTWTSVAGTSEYRLLEDATGNSGFTQFTLPFAAVATTVDVRRPLHLRANARYILQSCDFALRCTDSNTVTVSGELAQAIGYLKASNPDPSDTFGRQIALSGDGSTLVVATQSEDSAARGIDGDQRDNSATEAGAAYVFVRSFDGSWVQQAYLKASNAGPSDTFGFSLAISTDGNTLAVGSATEDSSATGVNGDQNNENAISSGAVFVFTRSGNTWTQQAFVKASNTESEDRFGWDVALSGSGNTLAVGAIWEASAASGVDGNQNDNSLRSGAVYVFERAGGIWTQQSYLKASNPGDLDEFGSTVTMSRDGNTIAVGVVAEDSGATGIDGNQADESKLNAGAVYVFVRSGATWAQQAYVKAFNSDANDLFGRSVALSTDGNTMAVGAGSEDSSGRGVGAVDNNNATDSGAVYVFSRVGGVWAQDVYLKTPFSEPGDLTGGVALSGDGNTLAVASVAEDGPGVGLGGDPSLNGRSNSGAVFLYTRASGQWTLRSYLKAPNPGSGDGFGANVSLSDDASILATGALDEDSAATGFNGNGDDNTLSAAGAVYIF